MKLELNSKAFIHFRAFNLQLKLQNCSEENHENGPHLETNKVELVPCNAIMVNLPLINY